MPFLAFAFFVLGAMVASFVALAAARLNTGTSIVSGRSKCDACGRELGVLDLVPVISWTLGGGRARCCSTRLSALAPASELVLGALFALSYLRLGLGLPLALFLLALALLLGVVLYDLAHAIIPPVFLVPLVLAAALFAYLLAPDSHALFLTLLIALAEGGVLLALYVLSRGRAMGLADAPLALALGLLAGPASLAGFVFSFWIGAVIGIILLVNPRSGATMKSEVPFAPFLAAGFLLAIFTQWDPFAFVASLL